MNTIINDLPSPVQEGNIAIVTGANVGLGFETALVLAEKGMEVILAARNEAKAEKAMQKIRNKVPAAKLHFRMIDLGSLESVRKFAESFLGEFRKLDLLVNNAGIMMPPYSLTKDGFESQLGTNYLGHFLLTGLLLPALKNGIGSRVVTLSSIAHKYGKIHFKDLNFSKRYDKMKAYSQSKLACLIFAYELDRRFKDSGFPAISLGAHPGVSSTNLGHQLSPVLRYFFPKIGQSAEAGARPVLMAASSGSMKGGEYCGPDGWLEMRGNPVVVGSSKISRDSKVARRLWEISEEMVNHRYLL
jgi:NAD(P)-dependent dehydrogenase (short-subunit alcohol dehydrogenase family)